MTRRRSRRRVALFRAWGVPLGTLLVIMLLSGQSWPSAWLAAVLGYHLVAVRVTSCRVATRRRRPCRWQVSGMFGCCDWHGDLKQRPPALVRVRGHLLPVLVWPRREERPDWRRPTLEPQPRETGRGLAVLSPNARTYRGHDRIMVALAVISLLVVGVTFWLAVRSR
jgi:hypothetical protein